MNSEAKATPEVVETAFKVVSEAVDEDEVLAATADATDPERVKNDLVSRGEYCVDHLCGCK